MIELLPKRFQRTIDLVNHAICLILMGLITWQGVLRALEMKEFGEASPNLQIPDYPFVFFLVLGCLALCLEYIRDLFRLAGGKKRDTSK